MKIEKAFSDLKSLLNFPQFMNKRNVLEKKMVALILKNTLRVYFFPQGGQKISFTLGHSPLSSSRFIHHTRFFRGGAAIFSAHSSCPKSCLNIQKNC
jgi:hypothetical protein